MPGGYITIWRTDNDGCHNYGIPADTANSLFPNAPGTLIFSDIFSTHRSMYGDVNISSQPTESSNLRKW